MTYKDEQNKLFNTFLDEFYIDSWRENYRGEFNKDGDIILTNIELNIRGKCNLNCKYCYMQRYMDTLYPASIDNIGVSLDNVDKVFDWLRVEKLLPKGIDLFGGEAISCSEYQRLFNSIYSFVSELTEKQRADFSVCLPANVIFLEDKAYYDMLIDTQKRFIDIGIPIHYSLSLDGKYCDPHSRPAYNPKFRYSDSFYDTVIQFSRECALRPHFHPMIARENIKYWKENFLWYVDFIRKAYQCSIQDSLKYLYLLEVRNWDWTDDEIKEFSLFLEFLIEYLYEQLGSDSFYKEVIKGTTLNILHFYGMNRRGLTCGLQTNLTIRTGDLTTAPCHRLFYDIYTSSTIEVQPDKSFKFKSKNPYGHIMSCATNYRNIVPCSTCEINTLCNGPCLGSNYEANKDMFVVPEVVCKLEKAKIFTIMAKLKEKGLLPKVIADLKREGLRNSDYSYFMNHKYRQVNFINFVEEESGRK